MIGIDMYLSDRMRSRPVQHLSLGSWVLSKAKLLLVICHKLKTVQDRIKLVLFANRKSHTSFRLVSKSVTLIMV